MAAEMATVASLWRYPVKSMRGEELPATEVTEYGLLGDRAYPLIDAADGKVATAKNPGKWPTLFGFHATFIDQPKRGAARAAVRITLPDGATVTSTARECNEVLSTILKRTVTLASAESGQVTGVQSSLPPGPGRPKSVGRTWTASTIGTPSPILRCPRAPSSTARPSISSPPPRSPGSANSIRRAVLKSPRFRANIVVERSAKEQGFVEQTWIGQTLAIGDAVRLKISGPCGRCVMTTLPQGDLPKDSGILRTAVQHNQGHVGVYAVVVQGGTIARGDRVRMSESG